MASGDLLRPVDAGAAERAGTSCCRAIVGTGAVDGVDTRIVSFFVDVGAEGQLLIWYRLWVDDDDRVRRAEMRAHGHLMDHRYYDFDAPIQIEPPT